jgi:CheY-like chemotaxis protein
MLAVSDTGVGMDRSVQARIFEPFFTTKEPGKGSGLGLSTVYGIVKQNGGNIWVYSEPGKGTTFKIYVPRTEEVADREESRPVRAEESQGSETVLVVEDEIVVRSLARQILEINGYAVLEATDAGEALSVCERHTGPIHLLLTDVVLPRDSGRELARQLTPKRPETKVLFMSGYTDDAIVHQGVLDDDAPFLQKPFTANGLARKVREVLDQS